MSAKELLAGLDIGGTKTAVLVVDGDMKTVARGVAPTAVAQPNVLVHSIYKAVTGTLSRSGCEIGDLAAIGAGVPGMVNGATGEVSLAVNLNLKSYPLGQILQQRFGVPVALENDVRAAALGAYNWLSARRPVKTMAYLSIGTGISAGLILDGSLYRGPQGMAGEIGHIVIDPHGARCACGLRGCLETISSGTAVARRWPGSDGKAKSVFDAAAAGDRQAEEIIKDAASGIAWGVQVLVMSFDVEVVVLGGGVINAGDAILKPINQALDGMRQVSNLARRMLHDDIIIAAPPEADVACWGAVQLALAALS